MNVVLAPDSYKECLAAPDVCRNLAQGIARMSGHTSISVPMADGGEGTGRILADAMGMNRIAMDVHDPLGRMVKAGFFLSTDGRTAVVETAEANGLALLSASERNPETTDSFGCGELIRAAMATEPSTVLVSIGGSATVDGGKGLAKALGYEFLDAHGAPLSAGGGSLVDLKMIKRPEPLPKTPRILVLRDVTHPLLGSTGAAPVFAPQKGADPGMVKRLEFGLTCLAERLHADLDVDVTRLVGGGAAGGMGAGLVAFLGAELVSGAETVAGVVGLVDQLKVADLVITGEGKTDGQSFGGKVVSVVTDVARKQGIPICLISGIVECDDATLRAHGISRTIQLMKMGETVEESMAHVSDRLIQAAKAACERRLPTK